MWEVCGVLGQAWLGRIQYFRIALRKSGPILVHGSCAACSVQAVHKGVSETNRDKFSDFTF